MKAVIVKKQKMLRSIKDNKKFCIVWRKNPVIYTVQKRSRSDRSVVIATSDSSARTFDFPSWKMVYPVLN